MEGEHPTKDQQCTKCLGTGEIDPAWSVGPGGAHLSSYKCSRCGGTGIEPNTTSEASPKDPISGERFTRPYSADNGPSVSVAAPATADRAPSDASPTSNEQTTVFYVDALLTASGQELIYPKRNFAVVALGDHQKAIERLTREREAYRSLAGIGFSGTDEADELASFEPLARDREAFKRKQERGLATMVAAARAARRSSEEPTAGNGP